MDNELMNQRVNMVWIGDSLSILGILSIKTWQRFGFIPYVWSYSTINNLPNGVVPKNAEDIMPKESLFTFKVGSSDSFGYGSYAHWSDIFQLELLKKCGGWYSQLDVTIMQVPKETEYYFAHHNSANIVNTFIMKTPHEAPFIDGCVSELKEKINEETSTHIGWLDGMYIIGSHVKKNNLSNFISLDNMECGCNWLAYGNNPINPNIEFIHWCSTICGNIDELVANCSKDSLLHKLLTSEDLI